MVNMTRKATFTILSKMTSEKFFDAEKGLGTRNFTDKLQEKYDDI